MYIIYFNLTSQCPHNADNIAILHIAIFKLNIHCILEKSKTYNAKDPYKPIKNEDVISQCPDIDDAITHKARFKLNVQCVLEKSKTYIAIVS